jgi:hypothetical protein
VRSGRSPVAAAETDQDDVVRVYYPTWAKWIGWLGLPVVTCAALWLVTMAFWRQGSSSAQIMAGLFMGGAVLYQCMMAWRAVPYLSTTILIQDEGFLIQRPQGGRFVHGGTWTK